MRTTFAPMEGITVYCYRNLHHKMFPEGIDYYYTPFLSVYKHHAIKKRDRREIIPENNPGMMNMLIPQIMTNNADEIIWAMEELSKLGFMEVNLNMGCPVSTVVSKHKGSGMLEEPDRLNNLFKEVFASEIANDIKLSVKTRLGLKNAEEFKKILPIFNKYPFSNVIIHPRVREQMYNGSPDMEMFDWAYQNSDNPVSYNGNIFSSEDYRKIRELYPDLKEVMIGRGLVANPALVREYVSGDSIKGEELLEFASCLELAYKAEIPGEEQIMHKMKEIWFYLGNSFRMREGMDSEPFIHKIRVAKTLSEYRNAVRELKRNIR